MGLKELASELREARRTRTPIPQLTGAHPDLTVEQAYEVQGLLTADLQRSGYKMGLTSLAKQREVKVSTPIRGVLLADDAITSGTYTTRANYIHPRAEPEIVFLLKHDLRQDASAAEIRASIASVHLGLEIIDSRYRHFQFTLPDVIADNTSAAGYVIGDRIDCPLDELGTLGVSISRNGTVAHRATADAILGDPFKSLVELLRLTPGGVVVKPMLPEMGTLFGGGNAAGHLADAPAPEAWTCPVLAGGVTPSVPFEAGDVIEASCATGARAWFRVV
jgi:2-oxo-3-hexenedioate decarboxylase